MLRLAPPTRRGTREEVRRRGQLATNGNLGTRATCSANVARANAKSPALSHWTCARASACRSTMAVQGGPGSTRSAHSAWDRLRGATGR
jgi:hypothetical protein